MNQDAKVKWLEKVSGMPDTEPLSKRDAEKLIYDAATALAKPGMRALSKDAADKFSEVGLETFGDLRNADAGFLEAECGMRKFDAIALARLLEQAPYGSDGSSANSSGGVTHQSGDAGGSQAGCATVT